MLPLTILALSYVLAAHALFRYLGARDAADRRERQDLFDRIQVPEKAMAAAGFEPVSISPFDDEGFLAHRKAQEEALEAYQAVIERA